MSFREWKGWVGELPWVLRWFVFLVLIRSTIDTFFALKEISPFLSPLYIVGILTPILITFSLLSSRMPQKEASLVDVPIWAFGALLFFNATALLVVEVSLRTVEAGTRLVTPILLYFYLRRLIRSRRDLVGLLTTFLYSTAVPFGMMIYERAFSPIGSSVELTRGFLRHSGLYADVMSYGIYFIGAFLISCYLFQLVDSQESFRKRATRLGVVSVLCTIGLMHIHHTASWAVAAAISCLLVFHVSVQRRASSLILVLALGSAIWLFAGNEISQRLSRSLESEVAVLEGRAAEDHGFHGRMSRWRRYVDDWSDRPLVDKLLGVSIGSSRLETGMLFGIHNDFMRIAFATGLVGLVSYLTFYLGLLFSTVTIGASAEKFLVRSGVGVMLLYSVTTVPSLYFPLLYLCFSAFAYGALPKLRTKSAPNAQLLRRHGRYHPSGLTLP